MQKQTYHVRNATLDEFDEVGKLMIRGYSQLEGFSTESEQPEYHKMLASIGELTKKPNTELLIAISSTNKIAGAIVYFSDMSSYGSGGTATLEANASGFRLLAVDHDARGHGIGELLINECIDKAKAINQEQVIIHSTRFMQVAWKIYEKLGFERSEDLDFMQGSLPVFGFRLKL
jgi:GNAT superfamily N-acetyltransferase